MARTSHLAWQMSLWPTRRASRAEIPLECLCLIALWHPWHPALRRLLLPWHVSCSGLACTSGQKCDNDVAVDDSAGNDAGHTWQRVA